MLAKWPLLLLLLLLRLRSAKIPVLCRVDLVRLRCLSAGLRCLYLHSSLGVRVRRRGHCPARLIVWHARAAIPCSQMAKITRLVPTSIAFV